MCCVCVCVCARVRGITCDGQVEAGAEGGLCALMCMCARFYESK